MTSPQRSRNRLPDPGAGFVWEGLEGATEPGSFVLVPQAPDVSAAFTTRRGGVSPGPAASLNLSYTAEGPGEEGAARVDRNRVIAGAAVGGGAAWSTVRQVHGGAVVQARASGSPPEADGIWTDDPGVVMAVMVADCVPLLLAGTQRIACVHAGWRGLVAGVVEAAVEACRAGVAYVGPAIGPCCYVVGPDVRDAFAGGFGRSTVPSSDRVDLWAAAEVAARRMGVGQVLSARICTSCHPDLFYSHRRDRGATGRQALIARRGSRPR